MKTIKNAGIDFAVDSNVHIEVVTPQNDRGLEAMNKVIDKIVSLDNHLLFAKFNKESVNIVKNIIDCL